MMLENKTLDNDTRSELTQYAVGLIQDQVYQDVMQNISLIEEENRYYNWYMGYTQIVPPFWGQSTCSQKDCSEQKFRYDLMTTATHGNISTKYFRDRLDINKIEKDFRFRVSITPPEKHVDNKNVTLFVKVEKNLLKGFDSLFTRNDKLTTSISPPNSNHWVIYQRKISKDGINDINMELMPGFRLEWYYNEELVPDQTNTEFFR